MREGLDASVAIICTFACHSSSADCARVKNYRIKSNATSPATMHHATPKVANICYAVYVNVTVLMSFASVHLLHFDNYKCFQFFSNF